MKKDYLLYLKKIAAIATMVTSMGLTSGCGSEEMSEFNNSKEEEKIDFHQHLIVDYAGTVYIFRECDDSISDIMAISHDGYLQYIIDNSDGDAILNSVSYGDAIYTKVDSKEEEDMIRSIEEKMIENGATLYKGLNK